MHPGPRGLGLALPHAAEPNNVTAEQEADGGRQALASAVKSY